MSKKYKAVWCATSYGEVDICGVDLEIGNSKREVENRILAGVEKEIKEDWEEFDKETFDEEHFVENDLIYLGEENICIVFEEGEKWFEFDFNNLSEGTYEKFEDYINNLLEG